ncbi:MAG: hypothetical protein KDC25_05230 [Saprospiraceae bacterium]|jgi:hypothetical protein|nr:hypothetical protein [Saprospiraceae bacterium]
MSLLTNGKLSYSFSIVYNFVSGSTQLRFSSRGILLNGYHPESYPEHFDFRESWTDL